MDRYGFTDVHELCRVLNLSRQTVAKLLENGEIPGVKLRGQWRIPVKALSERLGCDPSEFASLETSVTSGYPSSPEDISHRYPGPAAGTEAVA